MASALSSSPWIVRLGLALTNQSQELDRRIPAIQAGLQYINSQYMRLECSKINTYIRTQYTALELLILHSILPQYSAVNYDHILTKPSARFMPKWSPYKISKLFFQMTRCRFRRLRNYRRASRWRGFRAEPALKWDSALENHNVGVKINWSLRSIGYM